MTSFVAFIIGMLIGGSLGIMFMCLVSYNRYNKMENEYAKLRQKIENKEANKSTYSVDK